MRIGDYHVVTHAAGSWGYSAGRGRGQVSVRHDGKLYLYRQPPRYARREFRAGIIEAWEYRGATVTLRGRWPEFTVETRT
jgi:hypothetical protein